MNWTAESHAVPLCDGTSIPVIGLGTYADPRTTPKDTAYNAVKVAIETGYRHIDGALVYFNEHEVGQAIRDKIADGTVKREDIFYCGKLWNTFHPPELVRPALERTLKTLQLEYVDLYIVELPLAFKPGDNFYPRDENGKFIYHDTDLCATWEVECHPYYTNPKLLEYCRQKDIVIVGYSPLGTSRDASWVNLTCPPLLEDELLVSLAKKYKKTTAQIALRFNVQRGVVVIPKSFSPHRIRENFQIFDFCISDEDMKAIEGLDKNIRFVELLMWADHPEYPFHDDY
nr:aldo-keto reductase family 1 member D1-like isoform X1 [Nerophis lumbriciformis]